MKTRLLLKKPDFHVWTLSRLLYRMYIYIKYLFQFQPLNIEPFQVLLTNVCANRGLTAKNVLCAFFIQELRTLWLSSYVLMFVHTFLSTRNIQSTPQDTCKYMLMVDCYISLFLTSSSVIFSYINSKEAK